ncbi:MAG TPA: serine hydrolase domain-containing protein [Acidimicrobiales bacterium]|nr:serine hydrolase domain-containing protein [Acidimicrobiales bacterium]
MVDVAGFTAPGWERVKDAFQDNFELRHELGAGFSAYHRGEKVVDLWGGIADETTGQPWERDTIVMVFSTTKGATALTANIMAQQGLIDFDAPVSTYWPEFATDVAGPANGKAATTVDHLISHRAGLAWVDHLLTAEETFAWDPVIRSLEEQAPSWEPGTRHGYHATTFGWLVGEVVRRVSGTSLGATFRTQVAEPLGIDFHIGLPEADEPRVARLVSILESITSGRTAFGADGGGASGAGAGAGAGSYLEALAKNAESYLAPDGPLTRALGAPMASQDEAHIRSRALRAAELPAYNGIGDARSIACMYAATIGDTVTERGDKVRLLHDDQLGRATTQRTEGPDQVLMGLDIQWGLGFMLNRGIIAAAGMGGPRAFGHFGMGGSGGWADPDNELAIGYVMNRMDIGTTGDRRLFSLAQACYEVLSAS